MYNYFYGLGQTLNVFLFMVHQELGHHSLTQKFSAKASRMMMEVNHFLPCTEVTLHVQSHVPFQHTTCMRESLDS